MINLHDFTDEFAAPAAPRAISAISTTKAFFQRWHDAIVANRQVTAARLVQRHLGRFDEAGLASLGWSSAEIAALHQTKTQAEA
jgi:hypothetical protein